MQDWQNQILDREGFNNNKTTNTKMKNLNQFENRQANFLEEITYTIVMVHKGSSYTEKLTFKELFFYNEDKEDRELVFALNEEFEDILKMKQGDQMPVRVVRDLDEYGVIERTR